MYAAGWIADAPAFKWIGAGLAIGGVVAYLVFATAFGGEAFRLVAAIGILALGLALTVGGLAERLSRKSPASRLTGALVLHPCNAAGTYISPSNAGCGMRSGLSRR